ncbi:hypothetical protein C0J52_21764 [Blattella germanica]|nr:hypothetical protein C0J52_21764 [Blattella germanica]
MTNTTKMVEKNTERYSSGSHGNNNRHKNHVRPRISKSSTYFQSIVTPSRGKHRKVEAQREEVKEYECKTKTSEAGVQLTSNATRQGSPKLKLRASPSKEGSPRTSPTLGVFYAGAKFSEPPSPTALPKPPTRWTSCLYMASGGSFPLISPQRPEKCREISNQLKMLLNVSA